MRKNEDSRHPTEQGTQSKKEFEPLDIPYLAFGRAKQRELYRKMFFSDSNEKNDKETTKS